jgi:uncharacterized protein (DUF342 family)
MDNSVFIAIISASASIFVAALSFYLTKRYQTRSEWKKEKLEHYRKLLVSLSDLAVDGKNKDKANQDFSEYSNTICLVASQDVIDKLMTLHDQIKQPREKRNFELEAKLINNLMMAIRKDIGLTKKDNASNFDFHLIGKKP